MMEEPVSLKKRNLRNTRQRRVILEELKKVCTHPSADEIYEMVRKRLPRISLGTVYRNLEMLSELGEIRKLEFGGGLKRFDGNTKAHYHIRCMNCDRLVDAPMSVQPQIENEVKDKTSFHIVGHNLEFVGLCPECHEKASSRWDYYKDEQ